MEYSQAVFHFLLLAVLDVQWISAQVEWSHRRIEEWCDISKFCCGGMQSPVDLPWRVPIVHVKPLTYQRYHATPPSIQIANTGRTVEVTIPDMFDFENVPPPRVRGGGLKGEYIFSNLHFHWGSNYSQGAEHTLNGMRFSMEAHFVHFRDKFQNLDEARNSRESDAIAVFSVLIAPSGKSNRALNSIADQLPEITFADQKTFIRNPFSLVDLIPTTKDGFYRYFGSLTTPTCDQVVVWTVFEQVKYVSAHEIAAFRTLFTTKADEIPGDRLVDNFRPTQFTNGRTIYKLKPISRK